MENNVFKNIADSIITKGLEREIRKKALFSEGTKKSILENYSNRDFYNLSENINEFEYQKNKLKQFFNKNDLFSEFIGTHPDFKDVDEQGEKHYITSVFVDIKGSTKLATIEGLSLEEVREIKNKILTAAITVFQVFDGHIHRLQGDAIFAYFGNKRKSKSDSIIDALNATTILQYVFKEHVSKLFKEMDYPEIKIRTGIDFGDDEQVLWSKYGIGGCTEITTTSIHTDLAAKLQHKAGANKIMIGDNVKEYLDLPLEFYSVKKVQKNSEQVEEPYILEYSEFKYKMWEFKWEKYLTTFSKIPQVSFLPVPKYIYIPERDYTVNCDFKKSNEFNWIKYDKNSCAIPKKCDLKFSITFLDNQLKYISKKIEWEVNNRGKEAEKADNLNFIHKTGINNDFECPQQTAYKGHHYMKVKIISTENRVLAEDFFGIYVGD